MIVEMAAIVGSIKSLRALNMCLVNVALTPPEMKIEMMTESRLWLADREDTLLAQTNHEKSFRHYRACAFSRRTCF